MNQFDIIPSYFVHFDKCHAHFMLEVLFLGCMEKYNFFQVWTSMGKKKRAYGKNIYVSSICYGKKHEYG